MPEALNAVIYARYSSDRQTEQSIEGQLRECYAFAKANDIAVIDTYIDRAISGKTDNRPAFQKMIEDSAKRQFQAVIVYRLDRFTRNRYDSAIYKARLKKNGVKVLSAMENLNGSPESIIMESLLEGMAEYYSVELSQKITRGMRENALKGKALGGQRVLGYKVNSDCYFEIDETTAPVVVDIFKLYSSGKTVKEICDILNARGVKTARGGAFNKNSLHTILTNKKYIGIYKTKYGEIVGGIPAIIDKELFEMVALRMEQNKKAPARAKAEINYLLSTKLFCGKCRSAMVGESGTSKTGKKYYYYACVKKKREKACNKSNVKKDWIEDLVIQRTVTDILKDDVIEKIADRLVELQKAEAAQSGTMLYLENSLAEIQVSIKNIMTAIEKGIITESTKTRLTELEDEKRNVEIEIAKESIARRIISREQIIYWISSFKDGDITSEKYRQQLIDTFVHAVFVYDDKIVITYNYSGENNTATISDLDLSSPPMTRILLLQCSCYFYTHSRFSNLRLIFTRYDKICIIIPEGDPMRILLAEDEKSLNRIITKQLKAAGYSVDSCFDGGEAYDLITSTDYDAAVFDVMMPIMNGFELVKKIRAHGIDTPVLFLTARDSIEDRVTGLDIGADDYLIKPFSFDELSARLRVMTRKKYGEKTGIISVGDLTVDTAARRVERAGREISLSAKEYELLQYLVMNKGVVLSREKIEDHIWNYDYEGGTNVVDVYIRYLRKKIDEGEDIKLIHTVRGAGYVIK